MQTSTFNRIYKTAQQVNLESNDWFNYAGFFWVNLSNREGKTMSIATIILDQLGGPGFVMMTGAKNFVSDGNTLRMTLPRNASGANRLYITLTPMDDYTMRFFKHTNGRITRTGRWIDDKNTDVEVVNGVFCDTLQENFTRVTGLATHL